MKDYEEKNFYQEDEKKYVLKKNKEFKNLLKMLESKGYNHPDLEKMQNSIERTRLWYEFKYPELEFDIEEGYYSKESGVKSIAKSMNTEQLLARIDDGVAYLLKGYYKSRGWGLWKKLDSEGNLCPCWAMSVFLNSKQRYGIDKLIHVDNKDGKIIEPFTYDKMYKYNGVKIEDYIKELESNGTSYDLSEVKSSIFQHDCDLYIREELIKLTALRIMYSETTNPVRGYIRANRYITECNKDLGTNVSKHDINEIITRKYNYCRPKELPVVTSEEVKNKNKEVVKMLLKKR